MNDNETVNEKQVEGESKTKNDLERTVHPENDEGGNGLDQSWKSDGDSDHSSKMTNTVSPEAYQRSIGARNSDYELLKTDARISYLLNKSTDLNDYVTEQIRLTKELDEIDASWTNKLRSARGATEQEMACRLYEECKLNLTNFVLVRRKLIGCAALFSDREWNSALWVRTSELERYENIRLRMGQTWKEIKNKLRAVGNIQNPDETIRSYVGFRDRSPKPQQNSEKLARVEAPRTQTVQSTFRPIRSSTPENRPRHQFNGAVSNSLNIGGNVSRTPIAGVETKLAPVPQPIGNYGSIVATPRVQSTWNRGEGDGQVRSFRPEIDLKKSESLTRLDQAPESTQNDVVAKLTDLVHQLVAGQAQKQYKCFKPVKRELPKFSGEVTEFKTWFEVFQRYVEPASTDNYVRLLTLKELLVGEAARVVFGSLSLTAESYPQAINKLLKAYDSPEIIERGYYIRLERVETPKYSDLKGLRATYDEILSILIGMNCSRNDIGILLKIENKFPKEIVHEVSRRNYDKGTGRDVQLFLDAVDSELRGLEETARIHATPVNTKIQVDLKHGRSSKPRQTYCAKSEVEEQEEDSVSESEELMLVHEYDCCVSRRDERIQYDRNNRQGTRPSIKDFRVKHVCRLCSHQEENHFEHRCRRFNTLTKRLEKITKEELCVKCFEPKHYNEHDCLRYDTVCPIRECGENHGLAVCEKYESFNQAPLPNKNELFVAQYKLGEQSDKSVVSQYSIECGGINDLRDYETHELVVKNDIVCVSKSGKNKAALMAMTVDAQKTGTLELTPVTLFLDTGSSHSYVKESLIRKLGLIVLDEGSIKLNTAGGQSKSFSSKRVTIRLVSENGVSHKFTLSSLPDICLGWERVELTREDREFCCQTQTKLPRKLPEKVIPEILFGVNEFMKLYQDHGTELPSGRFLANTVFGPVLAGSGNHQTEQMCNVGYRITEMTKFLNSMTSLELLGITDPINGKADDKLNSDLENYYLRTIRLDDEGVVLALPRIREQTLGGDNYNLCATRFRKLIMNPRTTVEKLECYDKIFSEQLARKFIEVVPENEWRNPRDSEWCYHIPWFAVLKDSSTTAVRPVLDASSKEPNCRSLNDCLHSGPVLLPHLLALSFSARTVKYLVIADVEKAFHQIGIRPEDRDVTRFFWLKDYTKGYSKDNVVMYRHRKLPFGLTSSPFLLAIGIIGGLRIKFPELEDTLTKGTYVDNCLFGARDPAEVWTVYRKYKHAFSELGMNLREFTSNHTDLLSSIAESDRAKRPIDAKILGLNWNTQSDLIRIPIKMEFENSPTKRKVVSKGSSTFDPMGLCIPYLLKYKVFVQKLWRLAKEWDEKLNPELESEWKAICDQVCSFELTVPRISVIWEDNSVEGCVFVDASKEGVCCALYLRKKVCDDNYEVRLQMAKSRLAPQGDELVTIPRLELVSLFMGMNLLTYLAKHLKLNWKRLFLFSDSKIALQQVQSNKVTNVFVTNRVRTIRNGSRLLSETCDVNFCYVPTTLNPADIGTRGLTKSDDNSVWLHGSPFLKRSIQNWDFNPEIFQVRTETPLEYSNIGVQKRRRKPVDVTTLFRGPRDIEYAEDSEITRVLSVVTKSQPRVIKQTIDGWKLARSGFCKENLTKFVRWSQFSRFSEVLSWYFRLKQRCRKLWVKKGKYPITISTTREEFLNLKMAIIKVIQKESGITSEIPEHFGLPVITDEHGVIRLKTRLGSVYNENDVRPVVLDRFHPAVKLIINDIHESQKHGSTNVVYEKFRKSYFVLSGLTTVKQVLGQCIDCKKRHGMPYSYPPMPDLPNDRVTCSHPFEHTGLDYAGPYEVLRNVEGKTYTIKVWMCLFTCLTSRAIHLEIAESLSTRDFLSCLMKFISKRGAPSTIRTDNQPAFKLGQKLTESCIEVVRGETDKEMSEYQKHHISWRFISSYSPWKAGHYEALVRSVKTVLNTEFCKNMTIGAFELLVAESMRIVNERPLTRVSDHLSYVRPIDIIEPNRGVSVVFGCEFEKTNDPDFNWVESHEAVNRFLKQGYRKTEQIWEKWQKSYLQKLKEELPKTSVPKRSSGISPEVGDVVLLIEKARKREDWLVGTVSELILDDDGNCRSCKVEYENGITIRASCKLIPLRRNRKYVTRNPTSKELVTEEVARGDTRNPRKAQFTGNYRQ